MRAVVFDMDGVIVDSESQWKELEEEFFRATVPSWKAADHEQIVGMGVEDVFHHLVKKFDLTMGKTEFLSRSDEVARKVYLQRVELADGFIHLALGLKHKGIRTAIASSSPSRWIAHVVDRFSLSPLLDEIVSADDVGGHTKPAPDIYLEAASRLKIPTVDCLAIEDSSIGLLAAKRAGLRTAAFRTAHNEKQDLSLADFELSGFAGLDYDRLIARLKLAES
ncbi:MAG: HAD-IA family hydrolase [Elusimicrobia bacterium]|nr:HAD-IA family hydrolase [Elusimicrobiota bacterium]